MEMRGQVHVLHSTHWTGNFVFCWPCISIQTCKQTNYMHNLFLVYFVNLYMFRAYLGPSSRGTTVCIQLVIIVLFKWLSVVLVGLPIQPDKPEIRRSWRNTLRISCASSRFFCARKGNFYYIFHCHWIPLSPPWLLHRRTTVIIKGTCDEL